MSKNNIAGLIFLTIFIISSCSQMEYIFTINNNGASSSSTSNLGSPSSKSVAKSNNPALIDTSSPSPNSYSNNPVVVGSQQTKPKSSQQSTSGQYNPNVQFSTSSINQLNNIVQGTNDSLWYNDDWSYRKNITLQTTTLVQSETNFPIYMDIYDKDLKTALDSGYDILFTDSSNNKLPYERITFNKYYNTTYTHLTVWLTGNFSKTANTIIMMYWGNPFSPDQSNAKATWSNGYQAVYHLNNVTSTLVDSTGNYNATTTLTSSASTTGIDGNGINLPLNSYITLGNINSNSWSGLTIEAWINPSSLGTNTIISKQNGNGIPWAVGINTINQNSQMNSTITTDGSGGALKTASVNNVFSTNSWFFIALTWGVSSGNQYIYAFSSTNSLFSGSRSTPGTSILDSNALALIGASSGGFGGLIDEVRISNVQRPQNWLQDSRNQQLNYKSFYSVSTTYQKIVLDGNWPFNPLQYRKAITISHTYVPQTFTNYTIPLTIIDPDMRSKVQQIDKPNDVLFTDANGNKLGQEIEKYTYNYNSTHAKLVVWVQIPSLSSTTDTQIYIYYGNSTVVRYDKSNRIWTNFNAVWHLSDTGSTIADSTTNSYSGTTSGSLTTGILANAQSFNGLTSYVIIPATTLSTASSVFISGWFKLNNQFTSTSTKTQLLLSKINSTLSNSLYIALIGTDNNAPVPKGSLSFKVKTGTNYVYTYSKTTSWSANTWYQFAVTMNTNSPLSNQIYISGVNDTNSRSSLCVPSCTYSMGYIAPVTFGGGQIDISDITTGNAYLNGSMDELRISGTIPSANDISYTYKIESNSLPLYSLGPQVFFDFSAPVLKSFGVYDPGDGTGYIYAKLTDKSLPITAYLYLNGTNYLLTSNGTTYFYTYPLSNIQFNSTFSFRLTNATDSWGHILTGSLTLNNYTFNKDITKPVISYLAYYPNLGNNGTFATKVTDIWAGVKNVSVYLFSCICSTNHALLQYNGTYYTTASFYLIGQSISFYIIAYDVNGNLLNSSTAGWIGYSTVNNKPPKVSNAILYTTPNNFFSNQSIYLNYTYSDPENNTDYSFIYWYMNNSLQPSYNNSKKISNTVTHPGETWFAKIYAYDGNNIGNNITSQTITIKKTPVYFIYATLSNVTSSSSLIINYLINNTDNSPITRNITWYNNSIWVPSLNNLTQVDKSNLKKGENWYYIIQVYDGSNYTSRTSNIAYILNSPPSITGTPTFNHFNTTNPSDNLSIIYTYLDQDNDSITPIIWWYINGSYHPSLDNMLVLYPGSTYLNNSFYYYVIRLYDGTGYSSNYTSVLNPMGGVVDRYKPIVSNIYFVNQNNVICTNNCNTTDTIYIKYTFYDNDTYGTNTTAIQTGTIFIWYLLVGNSWQLQSQYNGSTSVYPGSFTHGEVWLVVIIPSDGFLFGNSNTSITNLTIANILPILTSYSGDILTSSGSYTVVTNTTTVNDLYALWTPYDGDGDHVYYNITWYNNGSYVSSVFNKTKVPFSLTMKGEIWTFTIILWDGFNHSIIYSYSILIINSPPVVSALTISGGQNITSQISITYLYSDPDFDTNKSKIIWYINNIPNETDLPILPNFNFKAGDSVWVVVIAYDGSAIGNNLTSVRITVGNSVPFVINVYIYHDNNDTTFYANDSLNAYFLASDYDGNTSYGLYSAPLYSYSGTGVNYKWYNLNTSTVYTSTSIPYDLLKKGQYWILSVQPIDQKGLTGNWVNSSAILILDTAPVFLSQITLTPNDPTVQSNLEIPNPDCFDYDNDFCQITIKWYVNNSIVEYNSTLLASGNFRKNQNVTVVVILFDGQKQTIQVAHVFILNTIPTIDSITINNNNYNVYTNQSLVLSFNYYDADEDKNASTTIRWYYIYKGVTYFVSSLNNSYEVTKNYTAKDEIWYAIIWVNDGQNKSLIYDTRTSIGNFIILNSKPYMTLVGFYSTNSTTYTNTTLVILKASTDSDGDPVVAVNITWYLNGVYYPNLNNATSVSTNDTTKGQYWYYMISIYDGTNWGASFKSRVIVIQDAPPFETGFGFIFPNSAINPASNRTFYLVDENITIFVIYHDTDNDTNASAIYWYKNDVPQYDLTNLTTIPSSYLTPGDTWYAILVLSDGQVLGNLGHPIKSAIVYILKAPTISNMTYSIPPLSSNSPEGVYDLQITTNSSTYSVDKIEIDLDPNLQNDSSVASLLGNLTVNIYNIPSSTNFVWETSDINLFPNNKEAFANFIGKSVVFEIKLYSTVIDANTGVKYSIWRIYYYSILIKDLTPPRVGDVTVQFDNANNGNTPTNITFTVEVEDYGSGVKNVTIYYKFVPINSAGTSSTLQSYKLYNSNQLPQGFLILYLTKVDSTHYSGTIPFPANASVKVIYQVVVFDNNGNFNINAWPKGLDQNSAVSFILPTGLSIEVVLLIIGLIVIFALVATYVGIRKFRKTEIIGLDVEKVMNEAMKMSDTEVKALLNTHSLGIVLSTFHQTQGPLPFFALPNILTDNMEKLIDISDRSFSAVRFVDNFTSEMQITFDYTVSSALQIASVSYGFSLNRPNLRGGSDNITFNILVHKPYDAIINQFINQISPYIHEIHTILDKDEENKELIEKKTEFLRLLISKIIFAYQKLYPDENIEDLIE